MLSAEKDQVRWPGASVLSVHADQQYLQLGPNKGSSGPQQTVSAHFTISSHSSHIPSSYVQELEARLIQMEGLLTQVGTSASRPDSMVSAPPPSRKQQLPATPTSQPTARPQQRRPSNDVPTDKETSSYLDPSVNQAPAEPDHFGQLAMDHNGHLRWIGGSAAMTLVDAFRNISNRSAKSFAKPGARTNQAEGKTAAHNLYFPPIFRSDVRALPGPEQAEFPPRDLADKLVRYIECNKATSMNPSTCLGCRLLHSLPPYIARG